MRRDRDQCHGRRRDDPLCLRKQTLDLLPLSAQLRRPRPPICNVRSTSTPAVQLLATNSRFGRTLTLPDHPPTSGILSRPAVQASSNARLPTANTTLSVDYDFCHIAAAARGRVTPRLSLLQHPRLLDSRSLAIDVGGRALPRHRRPIGEITFPGWPDALSEAADCVYPARRSSRSAEATAAEGCAARRSSRSAVAEGWAGPVR